MTIIADDRENGEVIELLRKLNVDVEVKRLKIGDYVFGDVVIERKTIDDFCLSIIDGRIKSQIEKMQEYKHKYILISGRIGDRTSDINENCILGMICSVIVRYGINVICLDNEKQLAYVIKKLYEKYEEEKKTNVIKE